MPESKTNTRRKPRPWSGPMHEAAMRLARATRDGDPEAVAQARTELTAAMLRRDIQQALAAAPPMTETQRAELADLLVPGRSERSAS